MSDLTAYDGDDFYCDVAIPDPGALRVVHEDDRVLAFHHTRPYWQVHVVVVPKRHLASLTTVTADDEADVRALLAVVQAVARGVEAEHGAAAVLTNLGDYQDSKHLHVHVHSGARTAAEGGLTRRLRRRSRRGDLQITTGSGTILSCREQTTS